MNAKSVAIRQVLRNHVFLYLLAGFLLFATCLLHFWNLENMPGGVHVDESSVAYNAYCIYKTGADEHGTKYPLFFKCFGNYQDPVMIYSAVPMAGLFGLDKAAIRFLSALFHILASVALFFLVSKLIRNRMICLVSAFTFSVLPWLFPISRTGIGGYMAMLLGIIGGCYFLFDAIGRKSTVSSVLAGIFWSFAMYSHHIGKPMSAVILTCFVLALNKRIMKRLKVFSVFMASFAFLLVPMAISSLIRPESMTSRFNSIALWRESSTWIEIATGMLQRYIEYFSFDFLFIAGDRDLRHNVGAGELYLFFVPLLVAGVYVIVKNFKGNPFYRFIFLCLLTYPAAAVLTISHYHSTRCMNGAPFWCIAAAIGLNYFCQERKKYAVVLIAVILLATFEIPSYMSRYFGRYQIDSRESFSAGSIEAIQKSIGHLGKDETLYISRYMFFPEEMKPGFKPEFYTNILFLAKIDPVVYQREGLPKEKVRLYDEEFDRPGIFLTLDSLYLLDENNNLRISRDFEKRPGKLKLIERIPTPSGINFEIYRVY
ncbi:MAG TPA: hypothetical protein DET40_19490 [Lentisphaeria bacterium]|nr:MAG: hypothetical protein A2X45_18320 [Lentisphaerae bacterium GWF2_50_93]HCE45732.1 hypothetical protein [Lentisphaeria bacterium]